MEKVATITPILLFTIIIIILKYIWNNRQLYVSSWKIPGPISIPIIGNGLSFIGKSCDELLNVIVDVMAKYPKICRMWFGPKYFILLHDPEYVQKVLKSPKFSYKSEVYEMIGDYIKDGLISNSGPGWKRDRKIIGPIFNAKFVSDRINICQDHITIFIKKLMDKIDKPTFNVFKNIHDCVADVTSDIIWGYKLGAQNGENSEFIQLTKEVHDLIIMRIFKPWLYPNFLFNLTKYSKKRNHIKDVTRGFAAKALENIRIINKGVDLNDGETISAAATTIVKSTESYLSDNQLVDHLLTLYMASDDTIATTTAFLCVCLGMNRDYQMKAAEEINVILGKDGNVCYEDLNKLKYLDMCIKETFRLFPVGPFTFRKVFEEFPLGDGFVLPPGSSIIISAYWIHRDPKYWKHPNNYYPDHFLPENVTKRHPYSYIPFSGGPRSCIGSILAYSFIKLIMVNILRNFIIESDDSIEDIKLKLDFLVRSVDGHNIRIKRRIWD